jgi:hypothetical protein
MRSGVSGARRRSGRRVAGRWATASPARSTRRTGIGRRGDRLDVSARGQSERRCPGDLLVHRKHAAARLCGYSSRVGASVRCAWRAAQCGMSARRSKHVGSDETAGSRTPCGKRATERYRSRMARVKSVRAFLFQAQPDVTWKRLRRANRVSLSAMPARCWGRADLMAHRPERPCSSGPTRNDPGLRLVCPTEERDDFSSTAFRLGGFNLDCLGAVTPPGSLSTAVWAGALVPWPHTATKRASCSRPTTQPL